MYRANRHNEDRRYAAPAAPDPLVQEGSGEEYVTLSLGDLLRVIWRRAWLILLLASLFSGAAIAYDMLAKTPQYESSTKIYIGQRQGGDQTSLGSNVSGLQDVTITLAEAVETRSVAEGVIQRLGLSTTPKDLLASLSAEQVPETQFIDVYYTDPDSQRAQQVAGAVGEVFSERVSELSPGSSSLYATVWDQASAPQEPVSPKPLRDAALAFVLGAMLGIALAFVLEQLDDSWRSPEELEQVSGVPTFGVIPEFKMSKPKGKA